MDKTKVLVIAIGIIMVVTFICVYFFKTRAEEELRWKNQEVNQDQEDCIVELTYKENGNLVEDFTIEPEPAIDPAPTIEPEPAIEPE